MRPERRLRGFHKGRFCSRIGVYKSRFLEVMLVKDISNVKVIYREDDDGLEIENNVFEKI